nr:MAG TPA: putative YkpC-like protein [Bacteriophage sp.]
MGEVLDPLLCIKQHKYAILTMPSSKSGGTVILNII